jgi:hypothetical protein
MRAPAVAARGRTSFGVAGRGGFDRERRRQFLNDYGFLPLFFPWDYYDYDYGPVPLEAPPENQQPQIVALQAGPVPPPSAPPTTAVSPSAPLLLENQGGQWVRVPTGSEIPLAAPPAKPESASEANAHAGYVELPAAAPLPPLPPAVIVYRDGHTEEVAKYMIQGNDLYTTSDYYSTGSWTRKIPLADLDIPASLKLNKERGTKFNLPSGPNEVVIRF